MLNYYRKPPRRPLRRTLSFRKGLPAKSSKSATFNRKLENWQAWCTNDCCWSVSWTPTTSMLRAPFRSPCRAKGLTRLAMCLDWSKCYTRGNYNNNRRQHAPGSTQPAKNFLMLSTVTFCCCCCCCAGRVAVVNATNLRTASMEALAGALPAPAAPPPALTPAPRPAVACLPPCAALGTPPPPFSANPSCPGLCRSRGSNIRGCTAAGHCSDGGVFPTARPARAPPPPPPTPPQGATTASGSFSRASQRRATSLRDACTS